MIIIKLIASLLFKFPIKGFYFGKTYEFFQDELITKRNIIKDFSISQSSLE